MDEENLREILNNLVTHTDSQNKCLKSLIQGLGKRPLESDQVTLKVKKVKSSDLNASETSTPAAAGGPSTSKVVEPGIATEHGSAKTTSSSGASLISPNLDSSPLSSDDEENDNYNLNNQLENLEQLLSVQNEDPTSPNLNSNPDDFDLSILGQENQSFWSPHPKILEWYSKVSNLHLNDNILKKINEKYSLPPDLASLFSPAKLPDPIWSSIKDSKYDGYKHKILYSLQSNLLNALKPLLDSIPSITDNEAKEKISSSVQMLCSVNLDINRFRRVIAAPHLKNEYKKSFCKLPVTRASLFGEDDFEKSSDKIIKEYNASQKILKSKNNSKWFNNNNNYNNNYNNYNSKNQQPFRGGRGGSRGRGNRGRGRGARGGGRGSWSASGTGQSGQSGQSSSTNQSTSTPNASSTSQ